MTAVPKNRRTRLKKVDPSAELVEMASKGCADSFRQLVELHQKAIRLYLAKYVQCSTHVDDIAQEVFVVAFRQITRFRRESKFSTWLTGIARNKALEFLRAEISARKSRNQFLELEIARRKISRLGDENQELEEVQGRLEAMRSCLDQLPLRSKDLVNQYYFDQQSSVAIAAESNQTCSSVRMKLLRIRRVLLKCILANVSEPADEF